MNKQTSTKIISGLLIFVFVVSVFHVTPITQAASEASLTSLYSNPNQNSSKNPYKFKVSDVVNSNLLTNIVGCTGVVNKVSAWMARFISSPTKMKKMAEVQARRTVDQVKEACALGKKGAEVVSGVIYGANDLVTPVDTSFEKWCATKVDARSDEQIQIALDQEQADAEKTIKEQCFDGIALTLARNQLTSMTRSAMNWVNSGYGGNPFFVQNMRNFTEGIERNVIETGIDIMLSPGQQSPYASDFARSTIQSRGLLSSSSGFLGGLQSSLQNFVADPQTYYTNDQLNSAYDTRTALERAQDANDTFSRSFASGGWNAWLAFTQTPQNNPLGFNMIANQYLADVEMQQVQEKKDELAQNNGFLSQKTCIKWQMYDKEGKPKTKKGASLMQGGVAVSSVNEFVFSTTQPHYEQADGENEFGKCIDWKITTPGSIIKEKTTNYLNSPERQLELAKTINDSLNALFSVLISKLQGGGLSGLSDSVVKTNWTDNINIIGSGYDGNTPYDNNGAYDGFNLTRDLGNTYVHANTINLGTWNAKACPPGQEDKATCNLATTTNTDYPPKDEDNKQIKLYLGAAPEVYQVTIDGKTKLLNGKYGDIANPVYGYYTVTTAGKTKILSEGYNGWEVGDRALWDGSEWQNWKMGQASPINKRGVIQIQQDYIVAAKEILKVLPVVMTSLGELDYCLPGPNPNYKINSTNAQSAYQDWIGSMFVGPRDANRTEWKIDYEDSRTYKNLENIFVDNSSTWNAILNSSLMAPLNDFARNWVRTTNEKRTFWGKLLYVVPVVDLARTVGVGRLDKVGDCVAGGRNSDGTCQNYHYNPTTANGELDDIENRKKYMEDILDSVNNYLFQSFYKVFDAQMDKDYFKKMTSLYNDTETSIGINKNPSYIPMATSGFDLTKNIAYYGDDIAQAIKDYTDAINQAKVNIAKLDPIKGEVSGIIKAAQDRRDANLIKILNDEAKRSGGKVLTPAEYKTKYAGCLAEENIQVFDPEDITGRGSADAENCTDGIDNDLDGLTDRNDPDCPGYVNPETSGLRTSGNTGSGSRR